MKAGRLLVRTDDIVNNGLWALFPAINCDKVKDIPLDYPGLMGVPITFLDKHDPEHFELIGMIRNPKINGKNLYRRLCIRNLHPDLPEIIDLIAWFEWMKEPLAICISHESEENENG